MEKMARNIVLIGMPGCGKTSIGKSLAKQLRMDFIDIDEFIEQKMKMNIPEIFKQGEKYFRKIETKCIEEVSKLSSTIISTGGGVIKSPLNIQLLKENGIIIFIDRPIDNIIKDINTETRPLLTDGKEKIPKIYKERIGLYDKYKDYEIINDGSLEDIVEKLSAVFNKDRDRQNKQIINI